MALNQRAQGGVFCFSCPGPCQSPAWVPAVVCAILSNWKPWLLLCLVDANASLLIPYSAFVTDSVTFCEIDFSWRFKPQCLVCLCDQCYGLVMTHCFYCQV